MLESQWIKAIKFLIFFQAELEILCDSILQYFLRKLDQVSHADEPIAADSDPDGRDSGGDGWL